MSDSSSNNVVGETLNQWKDNLNHNTKAAFTKMSPKDWIRLVVIVGAYLLIRPYLVKLGARQQRKVHERDAAESKAEQEIHPNQLRGGKVEIPGLDDSDDEEEKEEAKPGDWGRNARVRQRKFIRETLSKEEERLRDEQEAESDKEIDQYLVG